MGKLSRADFDEIAPKMLEEAAPIPAAEMEKQARPHNCTGGMIESIKIEKVKKKKGIWRIDINFKGYEHRKSQTVAHALKAMALEYGTSKQAPRPFLAKAKNNAAKPMADKMQKVYNREVFGNWM